MLYSTAFALLAQTTGPEAQRSITYLTLIAGFASTIFWPLTSWMLREMDWHQIYFVFAGLHVVVCLPLHLWLTRFARIAAQRPTAENAAQAMEASGDSNFTFVLVVIGFSLAGFVSAATLFHIVPMLGMLGLGGSAVLVATLFGPAQVASRLVNMAFGKDLCERRHADPPGDCHSLGHARTGADAWHGAGRGVARLCAHPCRGCRMVALVHAIERGLRPPLQAAVWVVFEIRPARTLVVA